MKIEEILFMCPAFDLNQYSFSALLHIAYLPSIVGTMHIYQLSRVFHADHR